ncbi:hypothetical protein OsI_26447 [Oryza sativa Indica Group]|uniref:Uncharacterized protein n=1 Tax=Oryza sativa subsp. indica TaxID=39946 RepID=B8B7A2_ORYSI|nr:hypothetical protein OsI_26447 [Oryza sativa Indica Group]
MSSPEQEPIYDLPQLADELLEEIFLRIASPADLAPASAASSPSYLGVGNAAVMICSVALQISSKLSFAQNGFWLVWFNEKECSGARKEYLGRHEATTDGGGIYQY